jgi:hypothetical protein
MSDTPSTPKCANSFLLAACGDGIRLLTLFTQNLPGMGRLQDVVGDVMFSPTVAKALHAELGRNLERHELMFGPIPSLEYIRDAWAEVVRPDLDENGVEKSPPK